MPLYPKQEPPYYQEGNSPDGTKQYIVNLTQEGTNAPTGIPKLNTLDGTVVWTRQGTGQYWGTLTGAFGAGNTTITIGNGSQTTIVSAGVTNDKIVVTTQTETAGAFALADDLLYYTTINVTVYP